MGLEKTHKKTEAEGRAFYFVMLGKLLLLQSPFLGWCAYLAFKQVPGQAAKVEAKFAFIAAHDLGWVFVAVLVVLFTKAYLVINANGARAGARLDRPDQHIYKIMSPDKYSDAPYVLMATTGAAGRFNRAHRALYNYDEVLPVFLINLVCVASVFGPLGLALALFNLYGRTMFANLYTEDQTKRGPGFMASAISEYLTAGLVMVCAMKAFIPGLP